LDGWGDDNVAQTITPTKRAAWQSHCPAESRRSRQSLGGRRLHAHFRFKSHYCKDCDKCAYTPFGQLGCFMNLHCKEMEHPQVALSPGNGFQHTLAAPDMFGSAGVPIAFQVGHCR
jgi:hypothetical protein